MRKAALFVLLVLFVANLFAWSFTIEVNGGDGSTSREVTLGGDPRATDGYDPGLDLVAPPSPPTGVNAFFQLSDPDYPAFTQLSTDYRNSVSSTIEWIITITETPSTGPTNAEWSIEDLPFAAGGESVIEFGSSYPGTPVSTWTSMHSTSTSGDIALARQLHVRIRNSGIIEDTTPPSVSDVVPTDGAFGVSTEIPVQFDLTDDISGVDSASIIVTINAVTIPHSELDFSRIGLGYHISYLPDGGWEHSDTVCCTVYAADIASPANVMVAPYEFCFRTEIEYSTIPPYFTDLSIEPGDTNIYLNDTLRISVYDDEEGVSDVSIIVRVDGSLYADFDYEPIPGFSGDYYVNIYPPAEGWDLCTEYDVQVFACDRADPENCNDTTFSFTTRCTTPRLPFEISGNVWSYDGTDTLRSSVVFGADSRATDGYDSYDEAIIRLPTDTYGYFSITEMPLLHLRKDIRNTGSEIIWNLSVNNVGLTSGYSWDIDDLDEAIDDTEGFFHIGYGESIDDIAWIDMNAVTAVTFMPLDEVYIRYGDFPPDSTVVGPIIHNVYPPNGATDVETECVSFEIVTLSGDVDVSSIEFYFGLEGLEPELIPTEDLELTAIEDGYLVDYCPEMPLLFGTRYEAIAYGEDDLSPSNSDEYNWSFTTAGECGPEFEQVIVVSDFAPDTTSVTNLILGTNPGAGYGYDSYDEPIPVMPPDGVVFYFPVDDDSYSMLTTDIRPACAGEQLWEVVIARGHGNYGVSWDSTFVLDDPTWTLAIATGPIGDTEPPILDSFVDMKTLTSVLYDGSEKAWIILTDREVGTEPEDTYSICGTVALCDAADAIGSEVTLVETSDTYTIDDTYIFCFYELENGSYTVIVENDGYYTDTLYVTVDSANVDLPMTTLWSEACDTSLTYSACGTIALCTDDDVAGTQTTLLETSEIITVDATGSYCFTNLSNGDYSVVISNTGFDSDTIPFTIYRDDYDLSLTTLWSDACDTIGTDIVLAGYVTLDGSPFEDVYTTFLWGFTNTDAEGYYEFTDVPVGENDVNFLFYSDCLRDTTITFNALETDDTIWVNLDLILPTFDVTGHVFLDRGVLPGAEITPCDDDTVLAVTDSEGYFEINDLPCGDYCIATTYSGETLDTTFTLSRDVVTSFQFYGSTDSVRLTVNVDTDCSTDEGMYIIVNGDSVSGDMYAADFLPDEMINLTAGAEGAATLDTSFIMPHSTTTLNIILECFTCAEDFAVEAEELERPLEFPLEIEHVLSWSAPETELTVEAYELYKDDALMISTTELTYTDTDVEAEITYEYCIKVVYEDGSTGLCACEEATSTVTEDPSEILVIDYDDGATFIDGYGADEIITGILDGDMGYGDGYTVTSQNPADLDGYDLSDYSFIFVELGIADGSDDPMTDDVLADLITFANETDGTIYLEGADFGEHYYMASGARRNFYNLFGISFTYPDDAGNAEDIGNVQSMRTDETYFGRAFDVTYAYQELVDRSNDIIRTSGATGILTDQDGNIRQTYYEDDGHVRIASSVYMGGVSDSLFENAVIRIIATHLENSGIHVDFDAIAETITSVPDEYSLIEIAPNPFNPATSINYTVDRAGVVELAVYDINGSLVEVLVNSFHEAGEHTIEFNGSTFETGIYFARMKSSAGESTARMILVK